MCTMSLFGPSGTLSTVSGICTLPLNIIHDKIFLVLWFWLVGLALVALVQLARQTALLSSALRPYLAPTLASEAKVSPPLPLYLSASTSPSPHLHLVPPRPAGW